jgi:hypothetical protein
MRKIYSLLLLFPYLFSCNNASHDQGAKTLSDSVSTPAKQLSLPWGMERIVTATFPAKWKNEPVDDQAAGFSLANTKSDDYNTLFYFIQHYYDAQYDSLKTSGIKRFTKPLLPFTDPVSYDPEVSLTARLWSDKNYEVTAYKDGGKFNKQPAGVDAKSTLNYLYLVTERNGKHLDSLLIFYSERDPVLSRRQYFFIDKKKNIHVYRFRVDEGETSLLETKAYKIGPDGKFIAGPDNRSVAAEATDLSRWKGVYTIEVNGEETTAGTSNTRWTIDIGNNAVQVRSVTFHDPILCNGAYRAVEHAGRLELYYNGDDTSCRKASADFVMKKENGKFYAQGPFGEANVGQWLELSGN